MAITVAQIDAWRTAPSEHQNLEFKEAKNQFDNRKLYKYCVALANEGGGYLLLGVEDKPPRRVVGTTAFNDPIEMAAKMFQALGFRVDIERARPLSLADRRKRSLAHFDRCLSPVRKPFERRATPFEIASIYSQYGLIFL